MDDANENTPDDANEAAVTDTDENAVNEVDVDNAGGERVDFLTLDGAFEPDAVAIHTNEGAFDYRAVPLVETEDGHEEMSLEFKSTKAYISEVEDRTDVEGSIQFLREWVEE